MPNFSFLVILEVVKINLPGWFGGCGGVGGWGGVGLTVILMQVLVQIRLNWT